MTKQNPYTMSFMVPCGNPAGRTFLAIKERHDQDAQASGEDVNWEVVPQPNGVWIRGTGELPLDQITTVFRDFLSTRRERDYELTFSHVSPDMKTVSTVMVHMDGVAVETTNHRPDGDEAKAIHDRLRNEIVDRACAASTEGHDPFDMVL